MVDLLFDAGDAVAAFRAQRYAVPVLGDFLAAVREPAVQGLVGEAVHGAGGETVTRAFIRIVTALAGSWPAMFAPTAFDTGAARVAAVASQRLDDFGEALVELSNRIWVLGAGGKAGELETLSKLFALSETVAEAVGFRLTGPGPEGAPALLIAVDGRGRFEQLVVNTPGPVELWALTTSPRDAALRERLHERLAPGEARAALARRFPAGSARPWIEAALRRLELRGARVAASERDLLKSLAEELAHDRGTPWHRGTPWYAGAGPAAAAHQGVPL